MGLPSRADVKHPENKVTMKKLKLQSSHYKEIIKTYEVYLKSLGYPEETQSSFTSHVREFLHYLDTQCPFITDLKPEHREEYEHYLKNRKNETYHGGLASNTINKHYVAVNNFMTYLYNHHPDLETIHFKREETTSNPTVLKEKEIKDLYEVTYERGREGSYFKGQRDRAILAIYYGCGLRLSEGISLNVEDIDLLNQKLIVRNGKGNKSREVPIAVRCLEDLKSYINEGREWYLEDHKQSRYPRRKQGVETAALLVNQKGNRLKSSGIYLRIESLRTRAMIKPFSPHSLRHSVATHLLKAGMELEKIKDFLGHSTMESTQIYTHLVYGNERI